ncbi:MAG: decaprenyl-phosphate phosphoribosyltransferase [Candidatus Omnitrophica bacterium]|nr:decaprenyl-phosphate phosphoribosyltransferase [Candidatus Omnitrophota bacterium]
MAILALFRFRQWIKNLFVFAPLIFSGQLSNPHSVREALYTFFSLCLISSSVYVFNDISDRDSDRQHPTKKNRPLASGEVSISSAWILFLLLLVGGYTILVIMKMPLFVFVYVSAFLIINLAYSLYLKEKVIVDVLTIAIGYVVRVLVGAEVIGVAVTHWLLLCTFLLATFLGFSKRRHELVLLGTSARSHRLVLRHYSETFLDQICILTLAMTLTCYVLYTIAPETVARFGTDALVYSSVIVMFSLFRYLFLIHIRQMGNPVEVIYFDRQIIFSIATWVLYVVYVIYTRPALVGAKS